MKNHQKWCACHHDIPLTQSFFIRLLLLVVFCITALVANTQKFCEILLGALLAMFGSKFDSYYFCHDKWHFQRSTFPRNLKLLEMKKSRGFHSPSREGVAQFCLIVWIDQSTFCVKHRTNLLLYVMSSNKFLSLVCSSVCLCFCTVCTVTAFFSLCFIVESAPSHLQPQSPNSLSQALRRLEYLERQQ